MAKQLDLEHRIIDLADKDPKFRSALLKDAKKAIEEKFDIRTPERLKIVVVEDTADTMHLVLPPVLSEGDVVAWT
ncbi:MAG: nitrile hydratase subunit alpha [Spirochaetales bacterium]|nr:nitrile hydratase subunit alpha [Spirochaetales bacterium]